jgi:hypothetical protein
MRFLIRDVTIKVLPALTRNPERLARFELKPDP